MDGRVDGLPGGLSGGRVGRRIIERTGGRAGSRADEWAGELSDGWVAGRTLRRTGERAVSRAGGCGRSLGRTTAVQCMCFGIRRVTYCVVGYVMGGRLVYGAERRRCCMVVQCNGMCFGVGLLCRWLMGGRVVYGEEKRRCRMVFRCNGIGFGIHRSNVSVANGWAGDVRGRGDDVVWSCGVIICMRCVIG